ncbi:MAG: hypothetical protein AAGD96_04745 [Chloroflexota bacterium]
MTIPFSKTTRQLQANRVGLRTTVLLILIGLITVWGYWFLTAEVSLRAYSINAHMRTNSTIEATFPAEDYFLFNEGQTATFSLIASNGEPFLDLPATIESITPSPDLTTVRLSLDNGPHSTTQSGVIGLVDVETDQATPLELLLRYMTRNPVGINQR